MAVIARTSGAGGQHADVSTHEVMASLHCGYFLPRYIFGGGLVGKRAGRQGGSVPYPNTVMACNDGFVALVAPKIDQWKRFLDLIGNPPWSLEPRYRDRRAMQWEYKDEVDHLVQPWFADKTKAELLELFLKHRIPFAPLMNGSDIASCEHLFQRAAVREQSFSGGGTFKAPTVPYRFSRSNWRSTRAPRLGESGKLRPNILVPTHDEEPTVLDPTWTDAVRRPLEGITVLDLGTAWAGGIAGRILGDFGADVIKVESWSHMDGSRMGRPITIDDSTGGDDGKWPDLQPGFHVHGRSKRSITLNLQSNAGLQTLLELAKTADMLIHNFPPSVVDKLGLSSERLLSANNKLVIVGQSVAGENGALSGLIGYAGTVAALGGLSIAIGYENEDPIGLFEGLYSDVTSAITTVFAALVGVFERTNSGLGQSIDVSQWEATLAMAPNALLEHSIVGRDISSQGFLHPVLCPHGNYETLSDDTDDSTSGEWLCIAVGTDEEWKGLLDEMGSAFLPATDADTWNESARIDNRELIERTVADWARTIDAANLQNELQIKGVAAFRVCNIADIFVDEQLQERDTFVYVEHPLVGIEPMPGMPWKLSLTPGEVRRRAPLLGEHSNEVLTQFLHFSAEEINQLVIAGAVETGPKDAERIMTSGPGENK
jgi:crotonobetainyl-CoA:carnitine CoA-transferase CaiB-like acyl-CoA transferase